MQQVIHNESVEPKAPISKKLCCHDVSHDVTVIINHHQQVTTIKI